MSAKSQELLNEWDAIIVVMETSRERTNKVLAADVQIHQQRSDGFCRRIN